MIERTNNFVQRTGDHIVLTEPSQLLVTHFVENSNVISNLNLTCAMKVGNTDETCTAVQGALGESCTVT